MRQLWLWMRASVERSRWLLVAAVAVVLLVVVPWRSYQDHTHWARVQWLPFTAPPIKASDIIGNVVLYMPLGFAASRRRPPRQATTLSLAFLLSLATEASQVYSHGRFPSAGDVVCNVGGAFLGALLRRFPVD